MKTCTDVNGLVCGGQMCWNSTYRCLLGTSTIPLGGGYFDNSPSITITPSLSVTTVTNDCSGVTALAVLFVLSLMIIFYMFYLLYLKTKLLDEVVRVSGVAPDELRSLKQRVRPNIRLDRFMSWTERL